MLDMCVLTDKSVVIVIPSSTVQDAHDASNGVPIKAKVGQTGNCNIVKVNSLRSGEFSYLNRSW